MKTSILRTHVKPALLAALAGVVLATTPGMSFAVGQTDIANAPIASTRTATVKSNITLLMDTSNSMAWTHMPDEMEGTSLIPPNVMPAGVGYRSSKCNALYYDPSRAYALPVDSTGAKMATPSFTSAKYNFFSTDTQTRDLSSQFQAYDHNTRRKTSPSGSDPAQTANGISYLANEDTPQAAYYWVYSGTEVLNYATSPCNLPVIGNSTSISTGGGGTWTKVIVSATSGTLVVKNSSNQDVVVQDERANFAIWYTFYRTRMALTKSAIGLAFAPVSDQYRVGLVTMNPGSPVSSSKYEALGDFDATKRASWYSKLYAQTAEGSSPAREALARVGRMYASKLDGINSGMQDPNPQNYTCQQNFTIMTTDGYWNTAAETAGPVGLDGTTWVGQQDGTLTGASGDTPRPIWDGALGGSKITTDVSNLYSYATCSTGLYGKTVTSLAKQETRVTKATSQTTQKTFQKLKATYSTVSQSAYTTRTATQRKMTQTKITQLTTQFNDHTNQNRQTDQYYTQTKRRTQKDEYTTAMRTVQVQRTTRSTTRGVVNYSSVAYQTMRKTTTVTRSSSQNTQTTTTWPRTPYQTSRQTTTVSKSTSQTTKTQTQTSQTTTQIFQYNGSTEQTTAVASCTPGGNISCATETNGPTLVATCNNQNPDSTNNYLRITCNTATTFATAPVDPTTCTASSPASSGNGYTATTCTTTPTNYGIVDPTTCTASSAASSGNSWTTTTCTPNNSTPAYVDVAGGTCPSGTSNVTVGTWTTNASSGNGWTKVVCTTTKGTVYNDQPSGCSTSTGAGPNYITTTCAANPVVTGVQTCPANSSASSPSWTQVNCTTTYPGTQGVVDPSTIGTVCPAGTSATVANTYNQTASSGNGWLNLRCVTDVTTPAPSAVASCPSGTNATATGTWTTAATASAWTRVDCTTSVYTASAYVPPCTVGTTNSNSPNYISTVCTQNVVTATAAIDPTTVGANCPSGASSASNGTWTTASPSSPNYNVVTCTTATTAATYVNPSNLSTCPSGLSITSSDSKTQAPSGSPWATVMCSSTVTGDLTTAVNPSTCVGAASTTQGTTTTYSSNTQYVCTTGRTTTNAVDPATCTGTTNPSSGNGWKTTTCTLITISGPTPVLTCVYDAPTSANGWVETVCGNVSNTYAVASCTPAAPASPNFVTTTCPAAITGDAFVAPPCVNQSANSGNSYTSHTCTQTKNESIEVNSCTPQSPLAGNNFTTITCTTNYVKNSSNVDINGLVVDPSTCVAADTPASDANGHVHTVCSTSNSGTQGNIDPSTISSQCPTNTSASTAGTWNTAPSSPNWITLQCQTFTPSQAADPADTSVCPAGTVSTVGNVTTNTTAASSGNSWKRTVCTTTTNAAVPVQSTTCAANVAPSAGNSWVGYTCTDNNTTNFVDATTCTVANTPESNGNNWTRTTCSTATTGPSVVDPATCTGSIAPNAGNNWLTTTCNTLVGAVTSAPTCTNSPATSANGWVAVVCTTSSVGPSQVSSCTASSIDKGTYQEITTCDPVPGSKLQFTPTRTTTTDVTSGNQVVSTSQVVATGSATDATGICLITSAAPALPSPNPRRPINTELPAPDVAGCTAWPCVQTFTSITGGSKNSLADVAQYYYVTDLRPDLANEVSQPGQGPEDDRKTSQHMTTFAMGLGVSGTLTYNENYKSAPTGDIADIRSGVKNWPVWPSPDTSLFPQSSNGNYVDQLLYNDPRSIDDFWHAAINGRGQYFSARDPDTVVTSIKKALDAIKNASGSGTGAASSTLTPTVGDNLSYIAGYTTQVWTGNVTAYTISTTNAQIVGDPVWDAASKLNPMVGDACDNRNIYMMGTGTLATFSWNTKACDAGLNPTGTAFTGLTATQKAYFNTAAIEGLTQYNPITDGNSGSATQKANAPGENLVNFLRGQKQYEGFVPNNTKLYRTRESRLGDIVNSQPTYVPEPNLSYQENDYATFKSTNSTRIPMLYVGGNDGMLHAFYAPKSGDTARAAQGGKEAWAVVPTAVLPTMFKLADYQYEAKHTWYVDGTPTVGDMYDTTANAWKTMLIGGLAGGGKSFFALDVTNPTTPKGMWEFTQGNTCYDANNPATAGSDCHIGLTFGRPILTKFVKDDGNTQWVVLVTSGYNNVRSPSGAGDGVGYLYILDAVTGKILYKISTGEGDATTPSGLRELNIYVSNYVANNTAQRAYGTDLLGNVWRFDINNTFDPTGREAVKVGQAFDATTPTAKQQPITTRPLLTEFSGKTIITIGTGRMVGITDLTDDSTQSIYTFQDPLGSTTAYTSFRDSLKQLQFTQGYDLSGNRIRTISCPGTDVQCAAPIGWYVDLPDSRERVNIDPLSIGSTLEVVTNVPQSTDCNPRGYSWINEFDLITGKTIDGTTSRYIDSLSAGFGALCVGDACYAQVVKTDSNVVNYDIHRQTPPPTGKRVSWREIVK